MLYRTAEGPVACRDGVCWALPGGWNDWVDSDKLAQKLARHAQDHAASPDLDEASLAPLAPLLDQEVWACGVTYRRSREARMEESESAGGGDFYDRVYTAARPELFLKATAHRVVGPGDDLGLRSDSSWMVPEPELVLVVTSSGEIVGCTVGNDLSCRDIEGENPLYLPQAKTFDRCAALGPGIRVAEELPGPDTAIRLSISRGGETVFSGETRLADMKRTPRELVGFLFRDNSHPGGCLLMTGTGIVPGDDFALAAGDVMRISIDGIGTLENAVAPLTPGGKGIGLS
ncbi:2-hydroxyhepta-2,4-diene-1,7-dioate isomerase [Marinihelvus fidelis]|uniref:2-hydroxyhepta-2,4-diene-1,7-dioate isomerase n=2 Tax=Marinihelvus fidelis TaxID=2613842 RepID=A0A5N0TC87_9GAMM|nr:2-hydroxyhepta-2,4-diene-1,7-dioate isomerase [Marinihelvus fidelis]